MGGKKNTYDLKKIEGIQAKIKDLDSRIDNFIKTNDIKKLVKSIITKGLKLKSQISSNKFDSKIVKTEKEILELSNQGYDCQSIGNNKWLMRKIK